MDRDSRRELMRKDPKGYMVSGTIAGGAIGGALLGFAGLIIGLALGYMFSYIALASVPPEKR